MLTTARARGLSFPAHARTPLSLSHSASFLFPRAAERSCAFRFQLKAMCFSNFTCKYSRNLSTAIVFISCVAFLILSDNNSIIRICAQVNALEVRAGNVVLMGRVSVTISYSFRCLTIETEKYINENGFIENLAASKYSIWQRERNKCNNK